MPHQRLSLWLGQGGDSSLGDTDVTKTNLLPSPVLSATLTDKLLDDNDANDFPSSGDTLLWKFNLPSAP